MDNRIRIRHGSTEPASDSLQPYELGYAEINGEDKLYIGSDTGPRQLNKSADFGSFFDVVYPVGSVYFTSDSNFDPNDTPGWSGIWENVSGRYLYLGDNEEAGEELGDPDNPINVSIQDHVLSISNLPSHNHNVSFSSSTSSVSAGQPSGSISLSGLTASNAKTGIEVSASTNTTGSAHTHTLSDHNILSSTNTLSPIRKFESATSGYNATPSIFSATTSGSTHTHGVSVSVSDTGHSHSVSGSASFSGSQLPSHSHTVNYNGSTSDSGDGTNITHNIESTADLPRFSVMAWKRTA